MKIPVNIEEIKIYSSQEEFKQGFERVINYWKINDSFEYSFEIPVKKSFLQKLLKYFGL